MIHNADGLAIKKQLAAKPGISATLDFELTSLPASPDGVAEFSSRGPNVDGSIKPDLVAVGSDFYTASSNPDGPPAYAIVSGTSFSTPLVAGAAALLKGARPGLTSAQYRSLLINTATNVTSRVQESGAGSLNMLGAMQSTFTLAPTSLSFLTGGASPNLAKTLTISNIGTQQETYNLTVAARDSGPAPTLGTQSLTIDPGKSADVQVRFSATGLTAGQYEGFVKVSGTVSGTEERAPYWYAVPSDTPARITLLNAQLFDPATDNLWRAGSRLNDAFDFRITEASGIVLPNVQPTVTAESGGGTIISTTSLNRQIPGLFRVSLQLGPRSGTANIFRIKVGSLAPLDITITSR
jgi:minor extracellular serine protease Vpr